MAETGWTITERKIIEKVKRALAYKLIWKPAAERGDIPYPRYLTTFGTLNSAMVSVSKSDNLLLFLEAEQTLVKHDLEFFALFPPAEKSLQAGVKQLAVLENLLERIAKHPNFHQIYFDGTDPRDIHNGLAMDGARKLMASHKKRLDNMLTDASTLSSQEVGYLECRRGNWQTMESMYKDRQTAGLGAMETEPARRRKQ